MKRTIVKIREEICDGCGSCVKSCHEGALQIINGKAKLVSEDYCDGLKSCLVSCPKGAISFEEREVLQYSAKAVAEKQTKLCNWPVQLKLLSPVSQFLKDAHLLIAADCTAYAYKNFHNDFMDGKAVAVFCPKLDNENYEKQLTEIFLLNDIKSVTVAIMEVNCCSRTLLFVRNAIKNSGKNIPIETVIISIKGNIKERKNQNENNE